MREAPAQGVVIESRLDKGADRLLRYLYKMAALSKEMDTSGRIFCRLSDAGITLVSLSM